MRDTLKAEIETRIVDLTSLDHNTAFVTQAIFFNTGNGVFQKTVSFTELVQTNMLVLTGLARTGMAGVGAVRRKSAQ